MARTFAASLFLCFNLSWAQAPLLDLAHEPQPGGTSHRPALSPLDIQPKMPVDAKSLLSIPSGQTNEPIPMRTPASLDPQFQRAISERLKSVQGSLANIHEKDPYEDAQMIVFISTSMPEGALRELFRQASLLDNPASVHFVVRGFEPQKFGQLIYRLRRLTPDPEKDLVVMEVDPTLFQRYKVEAVPTYLVKNEGAWYEVRGAISLEGAKENVKRKGPLVVGQLWPIKEPDLLEVMRAQWDKIDWQAELAKAQKRALVQMSQSAKLPVSERDRIEYFTPTFTVPHDIVIPAHDAQPMRVLAKQGQVINILDHTSLQIPLIVLDPTSPWQVNIARQWAAQYPNADIFYANVTQPINEMPAQVAVAQQFGHRAFPWVSRMSERFGVQFVPALVTQEGKRLRIEYRRPRIE